MKIKRLIKTIDEMGSGEFTTLEIMRKYNSKVSGYRSLSTNEISNYLGKNTHFQKAGFCKVRKLHLWKLNEE